MKIDAFKKDEKPVSEIQNFCDDHESSVMEIEVKGYWILSLIGGILLGSIWLASIFM